MFFFEKRNFWPFRSWSSSSHTRAIKDPLNQSPDFASKNGFPDHHEKKWIQDNFLEFVSPPHARDYLAIWPPNTQRKCMVESKFWLTGDKCRDAVEFLKVSSAILISCFSSTNVTDPAFHRCLFSKLGSYNALYYRGLKSKICIPNRCWSAIADNIIGISQVPRSLEEKHRMMYYLTNFYLRCWFHRLANRLQKQFRVAQNTDIWS